MDVAAEARRKHLARCDCPVFEMVTSCPNKLSQRMREVSDNRVGVNTKNWTFNAFCLPLEEFKSHFVFLLQSCISTLLNQKFVICQL